MIRQNILITGASSGLGAGMAREFAARGRNLALCARRTDRLETLKAELLAAHPGIKVSLRALDVNNHVQVFEVFRDFAAEFGTLDRVIVNAGMGKGASLGTGYFHANVATRSPIPTSIRRKAAATCRARPLTVAQLLRCSPPSQTRLITSRSA